jgi:arylformamidase
MIDITMPISRDMPVWPGDEPPRQGWNERIAQGGTADVSHWLLGSHTGTHVDAPSHFVPGAQCIDELNLDRLVGVCDVIEVGDYLGLVSRDCLAKAWPDRQGCRRLLLRTRNSHRARGQAGFDRRFVALDLTAAELLLDRGVATLGIDYLSVERYVDELAEPGYDYPVHRKLLGAGVTIIEGLDLAAVAPGRYRLCCLPLRLTGSEAAPARAVLQSLHEGRG